MKIKSEDISVVVQGAVCPDTQTCLKSIRKHLPKAEIILSTWEGSDVSGLDYDKLLLNRDPGATVCMNNGCMSNLNRQIYSSIAGLKQVTRTYAIKTRSDIEFQGDQFLKYLFKYRYRDKKYKIFKKRILIPNTYCRKPEMYLFHPSDWIFVGLTQDLVNLFDIPLASDKDLSYMLWHKPVKETPLTKILYSRFTPEQYLWIACLRKNMVNIDVEDYTDTCRRDMVNLSDLYLVNNFCVLDYGVQLPILNHKYPDCAFEDTLQHADWFKLYKATFLNGLKKYLSLNRIKKKDNHE